MSSDAPSRGLALGAEITQAQVEALKALAEAAVDFQNAKRGKIIAAKLRLHYAARAYARSVEERGDG